MLSDQSLSRVRDLKFKQLLERIRPMLGDARALSEWGGGARDLR
ncbi:hypothetical protein ACTPOE_13720 [Castellaniella sp. WN]